MRIAKKLERITRESEGQRKMGKPERLTMKGGRDYDEKRIMQVRGDRNKSAKEELYVNVI